LESYNNNNIRTDYYIFGEMSTPLSTRLTAIADPVELDPMALRRVGRGLGHALIQGLIYRQRQIEYRNTTLTDEVVVRSDVGIKAIEGTAEIDLPDQPLIYQDVEVTVDRTHAQGRELPFQPFVNPVRRGMSPGTPQ
jgi:hypothetical protein